MKKMFVSVGIALLVSVNASSFAEDASANVLGENQILLRPQAGIGILDDDRSYHAGLRLLFKASDDKKYGMELTRMFTSKVEYIVAGVILERKKFGWFNMSIGSVGYFGQGSGTKNYPGMLVNFGWEPDTNNSFKPFVTLRQEVIFADKTISGNAISAGLSAIF